MDGVFKGGHKYQPTQQDIISDNFQSIRDPQKYRSPTRADSSKVHCFYGKKVQEHSITKSLQK